MAKLTTNEVEALKILRSTFENGKWVILAEDDNHGIYRVSFDGSVDDEDSVLLANAHAGFLLEEKYEAPVVVQPVTRDCICGLNPSC
jgi:hypothetical protein